MNEDLIFVLIFSVFFIIILIFARKEQEKIFKLFEQIALKRSGQVEKGNWLMNPKLKIPEENYQVYFWWTNGGKNTPPYTHCSCELNLMRDISINIFQEHFLNRFGKKLGMQDIQMGEPNFDGSFMVQGSDEMVVRNFLDYDTQNTLLQFKDFNPQVRLTQYKFHLSIPRRLTTEEEYNQFIDGGLSLIRKLTNIR